MISIQYTGNQLATLHRLVLAAEESLGTEILQKHFPFINTDKLKIIINELKELHQKELMYGDRS